tara:strand:- start:21 stop:278 length:258 start_codon:yes stop_codon:yes gene_type:complete
MEEEEKQPSFWELNNPFQSEQNVRKLQGQAIEEDTPLGKPGNCGFCKTGRGGSFGGGPNKRCGYNYGCIITGVIIVYLIYKQIKK